MENIFLSGKRLGASFCIHITVLIRVRGLYEFRNIFFFFLDSLSLYEVFARGIIRGPGIVSIKMSLQLFFLVWTAWQSGTLFRTL